MCDTDLLLRVFCWGLRRLHVLGLPVLFRAIFSVLFQLSLSSAEATSFIYLLLSCKQVVKKQWKAGNSSVSQQ